MSPSPEGLRLPPAAAGSPFYHSKEIAPQSVHDERQGKLVVGRDGAAKPKRKPAVAPKPATKRTSTSSSITQTSTTGGTSTASTGGDDTSTGDSGFVDARKYRKEFSPPKVVPRHALYVQMRLLTRIYGSLDIGCMAPPTFSRSVVAPYNT